jgi:hypothetical protein
MAIQTENHKDHKAHKEFRIPCIVFATFVHFVVKTPEWRIEP